MRRILLGVLVGAVLVLAAQVLFLTMGGMPVAVRGGPLPLERFLANRAVEGAAEKEEGLASPLPPEEQNLAAGAEVYRTYCVVCHGALGELKRGAIPAGMYPPPPPLLPPAKGVTDDPVGETHWKVKNGIRLTGMPAFEGALTEDQIWQVSLLLLKADQLPDSVQHALR
ncbi:MAG TPA: cytochrome c [Anaeromyxobacter sp.]|nr:cytochrome c [Anaeromyxobacter sp.]